MNDYELEQFAEPVARTPQELQLIKEMKRSGTLRSTLYWYIDGQGKCRMIDNNRPFDNWTEGQNVAAERRRAINGISSGGYTVTSPPATFCPARHVGIKRHVHGGTGLIFLHEEL